MSRVAGVDSQTARPGFLEDIVPWKDVNLLGGREDFEDPNGEASNPQRLLCMSSPGRDL